MLARLDPLAVIATTDVASSGHAYVQCRLQMVFLGTLSAMRTEISSLFMLIAVALLHIRSVHDQTTDE